MTEPRTTRLRRCELSTPGSSEKMMAKAAASTADLVFLDLEDAVAPNAKREARGKIVTALKELTRRRVRVVVILLDGKSFGGIFDSTSVIPELYYAGMPPYLVRQGDAIPVALSRTFTMPDVAQEAAS